MLRIGLVDLDTSHAESFTRQFQQMNNVKVEAVFDSGDVRDNDFVDNFCNQYSCRNCNSLDELSSYVDAVMLLSVNWDVHYERARVFLEKGIPTFIDKPIAGNLNDIEKFQSLLKKTGTLFFSGSGWRWCEAVQRAANKISSASISNIFATAPGPFFYYGIHSVEIILGLLGPGIASIKTMRYADDGSVVWFSHKNGAKGFFQIQSGYVWRAVNFCINGNCRSIELSIDNIHQGICKKFIDAIHDDTLPLEISQIGESVRVLLAAIQSSNSGRIVNLEDINGTVIFDGREYLQLYKNERN